MIRRVLLTLDGSTFSEAALPAAVTLAGRAGAELRVLSALEIPPRFVYPEFRSDDRIRMEAYLAGIAESTPGVAVTTVVREGRVGEEILREIGEWKPDVVVMATHGRTGPSRAWIGSTADRCAREADRPLLLVRPSGGAKGREETPLAVRRVLVALDGSRTAEEALPHAVEMAGILGVPLVLVTVVTFMGALEFPFGPTSNAEMNDRLLAQETTDATAYLEPLAAQARQAGVTVTTTVASDAVASRAILSEAGKDLLVMTPRGLGRVRRALLGSTADKVVRGAEGPVLLIPPREPPTE